MVKTWPLIQAARAECGKLAGDSPHRLSLASLLELGRDRSSEEREAVAFNPIYEWAPVTHSRLRSA